MRTASRTAEIAAPAATVFAFVLDPINLPRWMGGVISAQPLTDGPVRVGSTARVVRELFGQRITADVRMTSIDPGRHLTLSTAASGMRVEASLDVEPVDPGSCRVTLGMGVEAEGLLMKAVEPMVAQAADGDIGASLARLQAVFADR